MWVGARWYALVLARMPVLATGLAVVFFGVPTAGPRTDALVSTLVFGLVVQTVVSLVPDTWAEEVARMGFVKARLRARTTPMRVAALTAPLFAQQPVALVVGSPLPMAVTLMAILIVVDIPIRALWGLPTTPQAACSSWPAARGRQRRRRGQRLRRRVSRPAPP